MYALATATVSILRGTTENAWGDVVDDLDNSETVVASGIPVQLAISQARPYDPSTQQIRVINTASCAIQSDIDVRTTDRLRDDVTGAVYSVESVTAQPGPGFVGDLNLALRQVAP
jgi:hypothetical protein